MICETFLPCLLFRKKKTLFPVVGALSTMMFRKAGLVLLNPVTSDQENYLSSTKGIVELVRAVTGGGKFSNDDHLRTLSEERCEGKEARDVAHKSRIKGFVSNLQGTDKRLILCAQITGAWLIICGTTVLGTVLFVTEFWDFYALAITSLL